MTNTRRAIVEILFNGADITKDLAPDLVSFTYNDNEGKSDEIQLTLQDRERKWQGPWIPVKGDVIKAAIRLENWQKEGVTTKLSCGTFYVDDAGFKGPPDTVTIKALSVPFKDGGKDTKHTRAWEKANLSTIMSDLASSAGLSLFFDAPDFTYDRVEQDKKTDLAFAKEIAKKEGLSIKVSDGQLVVYDELKYESKGSVRTLKRGESDIKDYDFKTTAAEEQYQKVELSYWDDKKKKLIKYVYDVPGVKEGPTLKVNKRAKSLDEAKRWAQKEARNKNKSSKSAKFTLVGTETMVQGVTIETAGFGDFDTKYYVESASHKVTGGYTVDITTREVLSY